MLSSIFSKTVGFFRSKVYYNPTKLPDWATDVLFDLEKDFNANLSDDFYDRLLWRRQCLAGGGYQLPAFHEMFNACEKGQLKELLLQNVDPDLEVSIFSEHRDLTPGAVNQEIPSLIYDMEVDELLGLKVFLTPHHTIDAYTQRDKNLERLDKIAEKRGMDTTEFAKSLIGADDFLADYVGLDKIRERSRAVGDEWAEIGKIEIFFELLEDGLTLPTCNQDMHVLYVLKSRDENKEIKDLDITVNDIRKYMGTPEFDKVSIETDQMVKASLKRVQEVKAKFYPEMV